MSLDNFNKNLINNAENIQLFSLILQRKSEIYEDSDSCRNGQGA